MTLPDACRSARTKLQPVPRPSLRHRTPLSKVSGNTKPQRARVNNIRIKNGKRRLFPGACRFGKRQKWSPFKRQAAPGKERSNQQAPRQCRHPATALYSDQQHAAFATFSCIDTINCIVLAHIACMPIHAILRLPRSILRSSCTQISYPCSATHIGALLISPVPPSTSPTPSAAPCTLQFLLSQDLDHELPGQVGWAHSPPSKVSGRSASEPVSRQQHTGVHALACSVPVCPTLLLSCWLTSCWPATGCKPTRSLAGLSLNPL
jgi:hypothetical protein